MDSLSGSINLTSSLLHLTSSDTIALCIHSARCMTEKAIITLGSNRGEETPPIPPLARGGEAGSNTRCSAKHKNDPPPISTSRSIGDHCNYILEFLGRIYMRNSYFFEREHLFQGVQKSNGYTWLNSQ